MAKFSFKWNLEFRNLKITKLSLLIQPIEQWTFFKHLKLISITNRTFNVPLNIVLFNSWKNSNAADFYIPPISNDMKIAVPKNHLVGQILYRSFVPSKKRRQTYFLIFFSNFPCWALDGDGADSGPNSGRDSKPSKNGAKQKTHSLASSKVKASLASIS